MHPNVHRLFKSAKFNFNAVRDFRQPFAPVRGFDWFVNRPVRVNRPMHGGMLGAMQVMANMADPVKPVYRQRFIVRIGGAA